MRRHAARQANRPGALLAFGAVLVLRPAKITKNSLTLRTARALALPRRSRISRRAALCAGRSRMNLPSIDIDSIPVLETAVGLYGALAPSSDPFGPSLFELVVTLVLIIYD
jgi:hypothetical protein